MEHHPEPPLYVEKVQQMQQAIFYCYDASSKRLPVSIISNFNFKDDQTLLFATRYFPVTETAWNSFAAELHFHKKGLAESVILHGVAVIDHKSQGNVLFSIHHAEYAGEQTESADKGLLSSLFKPYIYFYRKSSELLMYPFRKKTSEVFQ